MNRATPDLVGRLLLLALGLGAAVLGVILALPGLQGQSPDPLGARVAMNWLFVPAWAVVGAASAVVSWQSLSRQGRAERERTLRPASGGWPWWFDPEQHRALARRKENDHAAWR
jgi:hypothetical protein